MAALASVACNDTIGPQSAGRTIRIEPVPASVFEGDSVRLAAHVFDGGVEVTAPVTWSVSDTTLAVVLGDAVLVLLRPGTVMVTARSGEATATYELVIGPLVVQEIELTPQTIIMGRTDRLPVTVRAVGQGGREITGRTVIFSSDDSLVAFFTGPATIGSMDSGFLSAVGAGSTTVHATVDGVAGTAQVGVVALDTTFALARYNGSLLPVLVAADSVEFDGVREFDELYADAGRLVLSGLLQKRYQLEVRYSQYHVFATADSLRHELRLRILGQIDRGIITPGTNGSLSMLSEFIGPHLEHTATLEQDGYLVHFHVPGENAFLDLSYVRATAAPVEASRAAAALPASVRPARALH